MLVRKLFNKRALQRDDDFQDGVAKDGLSYNSLRISAHLKYLFLKNGFILPTSPNTIKSIIGNSSVQFIPYLNPLILN